MLKILTVVYNLDKGGTQRAAQVFAEAYHKLDYDSRILALYGLGPRYKEIKNHIPVWHSLTQENLDSIVSWSPDIIHIHSHGPDASEINQLLASKPTETKVVETNVFSVPSPWYDKIDISLQLSIWAQWIFNLRGGKHINSEIIPYPVNSSKFNRASSDDIYLFKKEYNIPPEAIVLGRIGQSYAGKWSPMLIQVFDELAITNLNLFLLIVNPPSNIVKLVEQSKARDRVIIIPQILGDKNIAIAYSSMNVMVHIAEQGESFGMVLAESLLCEVPVVTFSTPWDDNSQCEVVGNAEGGYVVNSFKGLKEAIIMLTEHSALALKLGQSGRRHIVENFDHLKVVKMVIQSLMKKNHKDGQLRKPKIVEILNNSFDKPTFLTRFFIMLDSDFFRRLTRYSSYYSHWSLIVMNGYLKLKKALMRSQD